MLTVRRIFRILTAVPGIFRRALSTAIGRCITVVQGIAFWAAIPLPLVVVGTLVSGTIASKPLVVCGLVVLNVVCAAFGHTYAPETGG